MKKKKKFEWDAGSKEPSPIQQIEFRLAKHLRRVLKLDNEKSPPISERGK